MLRGMMPAHVLTAAWVAVCLNAAPAGVARSAPADAPVLNDAEREGLRLFSQSCGVCHTQIQQRTRQYGPVLSRDSLGGDAAAMRDYIGQGTPTMPGFRFNFEPGQIDAIVQYIKTMPPQSGPR